MKQPVHFGDLGPSGMARRFGGADDDGSERLERARAVLTEASERVGVKRGEDVLATLGPVKPLAEQHSTYPAQATEARRKSGPKGGRPAKHGDKPWEAEGISRALWYRRRKKGGAGE